MDFFMQPFFTRDKFLNIEVPEGETKAFISIRTRDKKEAAVVAAELHELVNISTGLKIYREEGRERFNRFVAWLNPKAPADSLGFVHRNGNRTTNWGLSLLKQGEAPHRAYVCISWRENGKKGGLTFGIDPTMYILFERHVANVVNTVEANKTVLAREKRREFFAGLAKNGQGTPKEKDQGYCPF